METEETKPDVSTEEVAAPTDASTEEVVTSTESVETAPKYKGFAGKLDKFFGISKAKSTFTTEILAGLATFLAMAYILTVNPNQILSFDMGNPLWSSVFIATALGALIGTLLMALFAKMPLAQAPGMGLNSALGAIIGFGTMASGKVSFGAAMLLVLISGVIFLILTVVPCGRDKKTGKLIGIREKIFESIPQGLRVAIPVGIGLFIAYLGFQNAGIIIANPYTQVDLVSFSTWSVGMGTAIVALITLFAIAILAHFKVKAAVIIGILIGTLVAMCFGNGVIVNFDIIAGNTSGITWKFWENFKNFFSFDASTGGSFVAAFLDIDFNGASVMFCIVTVLSFCMIDMFDTMGTVLGCCAKADLLDENGKPIRFNRIMLSDATATCVGALLGTSTVTTFVESGTGVAAGGRTGLTALSTSVFFLLSIFLLPIFAFIPSAAAAGALIYVGVLMMSQVKNIDFSDIRVAAPAFLTIILMPLAYSITDGIGIGMIAYVIINIICYVVDIIKYAVVKGKNPEAAVKPKWPVSIVLGIITIFFLLYFFLPTNL